MTYSLLQPLAEIPLAFFDVETTGASARWGDRITELGIVRINPGGILIEYQQLLDPCRPIGAGITALTGISNEMVAGQPRFGDVAPGVIELLGGAIIIGHNVRFDLSFLNSEFRRTGHDIGEILGSAMVLDTVRIARRLYGRGGNGLQPLSRRLGIEPVVAHRALADAQTTQAVFDRMLAPMGGMEMSLVDVIGLQGGPMAARPPTSREDPLPLELQEALEQRSRVMMEYVDARLWRTRRVIEPLSVRRMRGELVLVAHCHLRNDQRTFKVDRIVGLTRVVEVNAVVADAFDSANQLSHGIQEPRTKLQSSEQGAPEVSGDPPGVGVHRLLREYPACAAPAISHPPLMPHSFTPPPLMPPPLERRSW